MKKVNSEKAYEFIKKRIFDGVYAPGHSLMTEQLSAEIGVSRTPIREALYRLEADGLVDIKPRLGASVKKMNVKEFTEICDLRLALESHAAALCAMHHTEADLREIKYAVDAFRDLTEKVINSEHEQPQLEKDGMGREDVRFHIAIITAARNELMKKEIMRLHLLHRVVSTPLPDEVAMSKDERSENHRNVLASHEAIYSAIENRDANLARVEMEKHIQDIIDKHLVRVRSKVGMFPRELTDDDLVYIG